MKKLILIFVFVFSASNAGAVNINDNLTVSGKVKNETSTRTGDMGDFQKIENTVELGAEYRMKDNLHFFLLGRYFYDAVYDAESKYEPLKNADNLRYSKNSDVWLREAYMDYLSDRLDVRIGKQQVVWGTADGVKILDAVCPTDMREFTLDNFADSRIPLWMAKFEFSPKTDSTVQFLAIPDFEPNYVGPAGSPFTFRASKTGAENAKEWAMAHGQIINEKTDDPDDWENWSLGFRWLHVYKGFEYSLNYMYGFYSSGAHYSWFDPPLMGPPNPSANALHLQTRYERTHLYGGSFSKTITSGPLSGLTIRGEFAYIHDVPGYYGTDGHPKGVVKVDNYNYVLGFDKYVVSNWMASFQFIQMISSKSRHKGYTMLSGSTFGPADQVETIVTLKVSTDFFYERVKPEVLALYGFDTKHIGGWRISPKVGFDVTDNWDVNIGAHVFGGDEQNLFGQFDRNDQVFAEVIYGF
ncbi:MAG: DUF1302 family protein [Dissulfuribacterales bacterium]